MLTEMLVVHPDNDEKPVLLRSIDIASTVILLSSVTLSVFFVPWRLIRTRQKGNIKLDTAHPPAKTRKDVLGQVLLSHIDDSLLEDGEAVDVGVFWKKALLPKCLILLTSLAILGLQIYDTLIDPPSAFWPILRLMGEATMIMWSTFGAVCYLRTRNLSTHKHLTFHLFTLTCILTFHWFFATLGQFLSALFHPHISLIEYTCLLLNLILCSLIATIPTSPRLHQDTAKVYSRAIAAKVKEESQDYAPNVCEHISSSIFGIAMFTFVFPVIDLTAKVDQVDLQDLPATYAYLRTQNIVLDTIKPGKVTALTKRAGPTMRLFLAVWGPQWITAVLTFALELLVCPLFFIPHLCLQQILWVLDTGVDKRVAYASAVVMVTARGGASLMMRQINCWTRIYVRPRVEATTAYLLFQKLLTRNTHAHRRDGKSKEGDIYSKADIMNLISSDTQSMAEIAFTFLGLFKIQLNMLLGFAFIWYLLGPSGLLGLAAGLIMYPPAYFFTRIQFKLYEKRLKISDKKSSLMQEAIQAIQMIKMMAAEKYWFDRIKDVREEEFRQAIKAQMVGFVSSILYSVAPVAVIVVSFAHYTLYAGKVLTPSIAFTSIAVFAELRPYLLDFPQGIAQFLQELLSVKRIGHFLLGDDVEYLTEPSREGEAVPRADALYIRGSISWDSTGQCSSAKVVDEGDEPNTERPTFKLCHLDISFPRGGMTLVAGKFGSGKSLLLLALLGEASLLDGKVSYTVSEVLDPLDRNEADWSLVPNGVAYVPQTAWLQSLSIRDNILFGLPMNIDRYRSVIHAVGLLPDLAILEDSDLTEIGERGKILSGGQKARVSLARAVYSRASILLLDDVISAVDAQTSQHIIQHCFQSDLMKGRTIIIASHAVESVCPLASRAVFLDDGRAVWQGSGPDLLSSEHMAHLQTVSEAVTTSSPLYELSSQSKEGGLENREEFVIHETIHRTPKQLIEEESRGSGALAMNLWKELAGFVGRWPFWTLMTALMLGACLMPIAVQRILELWAETASTLSGKGDHTARRETMRWVILYSSVAMSSQLITIVFQVVRFFGSIRATRRVHSIMLESMLRAKMAFFAKTRAGSILQRFGRDLMDVQYCADVLGNMSHSVFQVLAVIVTLTVTGGWVFGAIIIALVIVAWRPGQWYRTSSRQVRRLKAVIPGPINALYGETVAGAAVIRAFGVQSVFTDDLLRAFNLLFTVDMWTDYIARWVTVTLRMMDCALMAAALVTVISRPSISAASAGFILHFASSFMTQLHLTIVRIRNIELKAIGLERTAEYRHLVREPGETLYMDERRTIVKQATPESTWPQHGAIHVTDLRARYGPDNPDILHDVSFCVEGGQRVGIVGATGGGKSTLAKAFFSFVDVSQGHIDIDGKDISTLPLGEVRSKLGIIAQDPVLLSGTLRLNLDIEGRHPDEQLYDALRQVQLIQHSQAASDTSSEVTAVDDDPSETGRQKNIFANLDSEIQSGGENLSAGQKQLVVLARALLKKQKILILDEATASIDSETDAEISRVVHEEFQGVTVLIIAHRLRTIMPCSKILVMDQGRLVQQGSPLELIQEDGGRFQGLCMATGTEEYGHLRRLAEASATASSSENLIEI